MDVESLQSWLGWCTVINLGILTVWWVFLLTARDWVYRLHTRWFTLDHGQFDVLQYAAIGAYKILVVIFNFVPWLALTLH